jgi:hypothetical protein
LKTSPVEGCLPLSSFLERSDKDRGSVIAFKLS